MSYSLRRGESVDWKKNTKLKENAFPSHEIFQPDMALSATWNQARNTEPSHSAMKRPPVPLPVIDYGPHGQGETVQWPTTRLEFLYPRTPSRKENLVATRGRMEI